MIFEFSLISFLIIKTSVFLKMQVFRNLLLHLYLDQKVDHPLCVLLFLHYDPLGDFDLQKKFWVYSSCIFSSSVSLFKLFIEISLRSELLSIYAAFSIDTPAGISSEIWLFDVSCAIWFSSILSNLSMREFCSSLFLIS